MQKTNELIREAAALVLSHYRAGHTADGYMTEAMRLLGETLARKPRFVLIYLDGSDSLLDLTDRELVADGEAIDQVDYPKAETPYILYGWVLEDRVNAAGLEAGDLTPAQCEGFPGWGAIYDYLDAHPELLTDPDLLTPAEGEEDRL